MPIYEYKCSECASTFEELRKMVDREGPAVCKICGAAALHILSSFNISNPSSKTKKYNIERKEPSAVSGGIQINNCTFENGNVGISVPKSAKIGMKGNRFKNLKKTVEFRDK